MLPPRYYLPREDVAVELRPSDRWSVCAYKGRATYWSAVVGDEVLPDLVWSYPDPLPDMRLITGRVSLFNERLDVFLDGVQQPKPSLPGPDPSPRVLQPPRSWSERRRGVPDPVDVVPHRAVGGEEARPGHVEDGRLRPGVGVGVRLVDLGLGVDVGRGSRPAP